MLVGALGAGAGRPAADMVIGFLRRRDPLNPVHRHRRQSYIGGVAHVRQPRSSWTRSWACGRSWPSRGRSRKDGLTYTFKLKKGVKWHDGKPFTARDVAFTFYSVLDPKVTTPHRAYFDALVGFPELTAKDNPKRPEELAVRPIEVVDDSHGPLPAPLSAPAPSWPCSSTRGPASSPSTCSRAPT